MYIYSLNKKQTFFYENLRFIYIWNEVTLYCNFSDCDLREIFFPILRELNGILYHELVKMNKSKQIKTIKEKVFHFERPIVRFGYHIHKK